MLTQLRFKNWRSLRDVTIENLQPINVFIGVNASGKTNILDALYFLRHANTENGGGIVGGISQWGGFRKLHTVNTGENEIELAVSFKLHDKIAEIYEQYKIHFANGDDFPILFSYLLKEDGKSLYNPEPVSLPVKNFSRGGAFTRTWQDYYGRAIRDYARFYKTQRWQMLHEGFLPPLKDIQDSENITLNSIDPNARNVSFILNLMHRTRFDLFSKFNQDLLELLENVRKIEIESSFQETKIRLHEKKFEMPTVSFGTRRLIAMLAAMYLLDMDLSPLPLPYNNDTEFDDLENLPLAHMPGLVVIEEPDMALNPGLLRRLVGKFREFVDGEHPRQLILTTHNPIFLNYFEPEEIRIVERDDDGYTTVKPISKRIQEIWFEDEADPQALGDIWLMNVLGGLAD